MPANATARVPGPLRCAGRLRCGAPTRRSSVRVCAADGSSVGLALTSAGAVGGLAWLLVSTDPGRRREAQAAAAGGDEMDSVRQYFNTTGFERWNKIYGTTQARAEESGRRNRVGRLAQPPTHRRR
jgi:hypothetical protein